MYCMFCGHALIEMKCPNCGAEFNLENISEDKHRRKCRVKGKVVVPHKSV